MQIMTGIEVNSTWG